MRSNWDVIEGNWERFKGMVRERWGKLTDDEVDQIQGRMERLRGKIQAKYGVDAGEADNQIERWVKSVTS
ncbi:MAG: CsbD family protein [Chloroflexi bacterium]|nr:CsbD family protein [Chloroflexota bacterium]